MSDLLEWGERQNEFDNKWFNTTEKKKEGLLRGEWLNAMAESSLGIQSQLIDDLA